jgi:hypothetical protein
MYNCNTVTIPGNKTVHPSQQITHGRAIPCFMIALFIVASEKIRPGIIASDEYARISFGLLGIERIQPFMTAST